jgi:ATP-dependent Clp protease ATP-binding subunit ClpB
MNANFFGRIIKQELENPLAQRILAGEFQPGDVILADLEGDAPSFSSGTKSQKP